MTVKELKEILNEYDDNTKVEFRFSTVIDGQAEVVTSAYNTEYGFDYDTDVQDVEVDYSGTLTPYDTNYIKLANKVIFEMEEV